MLLKINKGKASNGEIGHLPRRNIRVNKHMKRKHALLCNQINENEKEQRDGTGRSADWPRARRLTQAAGVIAPLTSSLNPQERESCSPLLMEYRLVKPVSRPISWKPLSVKCTYAG